MKGLCPPHWEDDSGTSNRAFTHNRAGPGFRGGNGVCRLHTSGSGVGVRLRAAHAGGVRLPPAGQERPGLGAAVHRQGDGVFAGATDPARGPARRDWRRGGPARAQQRATVRDAVRADRHSAAGRGRRGVRPDVGARDVRDTAPRVRGARGSALRTAGGHFAFARLQPARVAHLPRQAHDLDEDQGVERRHRRSQGAGAERRAGLSCGSTPCTRATGTA